MGAAELRSDIVQTESVWTLTTTWMQSRSAFDSDRLDKTSKRLASASMERVVNRKLCWDRLFASLCRQDKLCRCASLSRADAARSIEDTWEDVQDRQRWCQGHVRRSGHEIAQHQHARHNWPTMLPTIPVSSWWCPCHSSILKADFVLGCPRPGSPYGPSYKFICKPNRPT